MLAQILHNLSPSSLSTWFESFDEFHGCCLLSDLFHGSLKIDHSISFSASQILISMLTTLRFSLNSLRKIDICSHPSSPLLTEGLTRSVSFSTSMKRWCTLRSRLHPFVPASTLIHLWLCSQSATQISSSLSILMAPFIECSCVCMLSISYLTLRYVRKRPGVDRFLTYVAQKFEVVIFTASLSKVALDQINL